jgi:deoxyribodipyrimidine photo-lyase
MAKSEAPVIVWFRRDLRLADHEALTAAARSGAPLLPLFILDDETPGAFRMGGASRWWLHGSLKSLDASLKKHGGALVLRQGTAPKALAWLLDETDAAAVHTARGHDPWDVKLEATIAELCREKDATLHLHPGQLLFAPDAIVAGSGKPFRVFTPFWKACLAASPPHAPLRVPKLGDFTKAKSEKLEDLNLLPNKPDWAGGLRATWKPGEEPARKRLMDFIDESLAAYADDRSNLDGDTTSRLSPHLHFGEISPNQVWQAVHHASEGARGAVRKGAEAFLRELGWREFSYHLLERFPGMPTSPLRPEFSRFPWRSDKKALRAWQRGETGYPIVDAAMRQLWQTGWMPNRARMIVASFLVKHLLLPWQQGAAWFWDTLVDADLANNSASWQWVAGCGTDAAPYFRVFNPVLQGQKFDANGDYVRAFVPELAKLPASDIHSPWDAPDLLLAQSGVTLGRNYPMSIVEHATARTRALQAFAAIRNT